MLTFTDADYKYRDAIEAQGRELGAAFTAAQSVYKLNLKGTDITHAVLLRLKSFLLYQEKIKVGLGKVYAAPPTDFFVESVCFFLKVVLSRFDEQLTVACKKKIACRQGSMRPDISIWYAGIPIAAIECKTQLDWNRDGWLQDFEKREKRLATEYKAKLFLLAMTGSNWPEFGSDKRVGRQIFALLKDIWPDAFDPSSSTTSILHSIEELCRQLISHMKKRIIFYGQCSAMSLISSTFSDFGKRINDNLARQTTTEWP